MDFPPLRLLGTGGHFPVREPEILALLTFQRCGRGEGGNHSERLKHNKTPHFVGVSLIRVSGKFRDTKTVEKDR